MGIFICSGSCLTSKALLTVTILLIINCRILNAECHWLALSIPDSKFFTELAGRLAWKILIVPMIFPIYQSPYFKYRINTRNHRLFCAVMPMFLLTFINRKCKFVNQNCCNLTLPIWFSLVCCKKYTIHHQYHTLKVFVLTHLFNIPSRSLEILIYWLCSSCSTNWSATTDWSATTFLPNPPFQLPWCSFLEALNWRVMPCTSSQLMFSRPYQPSWPKLICNSNIIMTMICGRFGQSSNGCLIPPCLERS